MIAHIRTALFAIAFYGFSLMMVIMAIPAVLLPPRALQRLAQSWSTWHRFTARHLLGIRVEIEGERPEGQALYAIKHESFFEALDAPTFIDGPVIPFAKIELMHLPLWGRAAEHYGVIGVDRHAGAKALRHMAKLASKAKASGRDFVIFPEGTRVPHGTRPALQSGLYGVYKLVGLPIVPVAVDSGPLYQRSPKKSGTVHYRIGEAIPTGLPREELERRVHEAINALNP